MIKTIVVRVAILDDKAKEVAGQSCFIPLDKQPVKAGDVMDACQRSVAHCVDALKKDLHSQ